MDFTDGRKLSNEREEKTGTEKKQDGSPCGGCIPARRCRRRPRPVPPCACMGPTGPTGAPGPTGTVYLGKATICKNAVFCQTASLWVLTSINS